METFDVSIPLNCVLWFLGDLHAGEAVFLKKRFLQFWDENLKGKRNSFVIGTGDWVSAIPPYDSRHDVRGLDPEFPSIEDAKFWVEKFLTRWHKKFLWFHTGNHEEKVSAKHGDFVKSMCRRAGVKYGGFTAFVNLLTPNENTIRVITTHGATSIDSTLDDPADREAAMKRKLRRVLSRLGDADLYAMGHTHKLLTHQGPPVLRLARETGGHVEHHYVQDARWYANTGSFMKSYVEGQINYAERYGYGPLEIGCIKVTIKNGKIANVEKVVM